MIRTIIALLFLASPALGQVWSLSLTSPDDLVIDSALVARVTVSCVQDDLTASGSVPTAGWQIFALWDPASALYLSAENQTPLPNSPSFFTTAQDGTTGVCLVACLYDFQLQTQVPFDAPTPICDLFFVAEQGALPGITSIVLDNGTPVPGAAADPVQEITYLDATGPAQSSQPSVPVTLVLDLVEFPSFIRGDANQDGGISLTDAIRILEIGFLGSVPECLAAVDFDGDGQVPFLAETLRVLSYLFAGGPPPSGGLGCTNQDDFGLGCSAPFCP